MVLKSSDIKEFVRRMEQHYPKTMIAKGLDYVPFAGLRSYDPASAQFDIAQTRVANVREGYNETGWDQPRWINHISIRANDPAQAAEFYEKIFELKEAETYTRRRLDLHDRRQSESCCCADATQVSTEDYAKDSTTSVSKWKACSKSKRIWRRYRYRTAPAKGTSASAVTARKTKKTFTVAAWQAFCRQTPTACWSISRNEDDVRGQ